MSIKIIAIGKKHEPWIVDGLSLYQKRLRKPFDIEWQLLSHCPVEEKAVEDESARIVAACKQDDFVILLEEQGNKLTSPRLSRRLQDVFSHSQSVVFIIGGAYGVDHTVVNRANFSWSLSDLVFPHQLVRLLLIEQIYRAQTIVNGEAYHHS